MSNEDPTRLRRALAVIEALEGKLAAIEAARNEPIAIVGMACRFPGAPDLGAFWQLLCDGRDGLREVPGDRWDVDAYYADDRDAPGTYYARRGGFLDDIAGFDAEFFRISPREACALDPQQRLFLEVAWEALEHAGEHTGSLAERQAGVFVGVMNHEYVPLYTGGDPRRVDAYLPTGATHNAIAGRLSYFLGAHGPSMAVDTACSSSLVALHLACQSLRSGESELAIAGGVNLILSPLGSIAIARTGALAADGRCKAFSAAADGFARAEGCGVVVLKRLSQARANGDRVLALIRGSAVNQDGASSGLTVPNGAAQVAVLRAALAAAAATPQQIGYVEAHGTGTALGDPIEVRALAKVFAGQRGDAPLLVGSVKTNLGHLEPAAGIAGVIKVVLAIEHGAVPPTLVHGELNPALPLAEIPAVVPTSVTDWPSPRWAGVSAFSLTGTNAHLVLSEPAPVAPAPPPARAWGGAWLLPVSAHTPAALREATRRLTAQLTDDTALADLCFTAARRRTHHRHRLAVIGDDAAALRERLVAFVADQARDGLIADQHVPGRDLRQVWVFCGHGAQWLGMGRALAAAPRFAELLQACDDALAPHLPFSVRAQLAEDSATDLDDVLRMQPAVFAVQVVVARLLLDLGLRPDAVLGHSMGEIAAAHIAGALRLDEAALVIALRARLLAECAGRGAMVLVGLPRAEAEAELAGWADRLAVAVDASPSSVAISGDPEAIAALRGQLEARRVLCRPVRTDVAFHSPQMDPLVDRLRAGLAGLSPRPGTCAFLSTVRAGEVAGEQLGADYWAANLRMPVRLRETAERAIERGLRTFVEIGPHPVATGSLREVAGERDVLLVPTLRRGQRGDVAILETAAALHSAGHAVDFAAIYPTGRLATLPLYAWQRARYWPEPAPAARRALGDLGFTLGWTPMAAPGGEAPLGTWLIAHASSDAGDPAIANLIDAVMAELRARGYDVAAAALGDAAAGLPATNDEPSDFARSLDALAAGRALAGVIWLDPLVRRSSTPGAPGAEAIAAQAAALTRRALCLVQALARRPRQPAPRLWLVTRGARAVGEPTPLDLAAAPLAGLALVVGHELPELRCTTLDLDPGAATDGAALAALVVDDPDERQLALRGGQRLAARLAARALTGHAARPVQLRRDGTYLVTGGVTGLGLRTAEWLAERGAGSLLLLSRAEADPVAAARLAALRSRGIAVRHERADVASRGELTDVLARAAADLPPLRGVFHSAGAMANAVLANLDAAQLDRVMRPKVDGALLLHELTLTASIDHFVLYSSLVSMLGSPGQGNYVAANAFLDALAHHRRALGLPALSVGWAPWQDDSLHHRDASRAERTLSGPFAALAITAPEALSALDEMLGSPGPAHVAVMPFAVASWQRAVPGADADPLFADLRQAGGVVQAPAEARGAVRLALALAESPARAHAILMAHLRDETARVLRRDPAQLESRAPLSSLGLDSLMGLELRRRLSTSLAVPLPATMIYDHPTLDALATWVLGELRAVAAPGGEPADAPLVQGPGAARPPAELVNLSDDEAELLLLERLQQLKRGLSA